MNTTYVDGSSWVIMWRLWSCPRAKISVVPQIGHFHAGRSASGTVFRFRPCATEATSQRDERDRHTKKMRTVLAFLAAGFFAATFRLTTVFAGATFS